MPGAGSDPTPVAEISLDAYARRICEVLAQGPPALLAGQSMGGMAITQAAARCPQRVAALAYVAAFLPRDRQSLLDLAGTPEGAGDQVQANIVVAGDPPVARLPAEAAPEVLYHCADPERAAWAAQQLGPQPVAPFTQPFTLGDQPEAYARPAAGVRHLPPGPGHPPAVAAVDVHHGRLPPGNRARHRPLAVAVAHRRAGGGAGPDRHGADLVPSWAWASALIDKNACARWLDRDPRCALAWQRLPGAEKRSVDGRG